ncbi:MAG: hemerythrin domain-containing protein [Minwuia sp.]|nr:hemerythrin domain-containing protein [Minwuia sp.]
MDKKLPFSPLKQAMTAQMTAEADSESSFRAEHDLIRAVCDRLEAIADALPVVPRRESLSELIALLQFGIPAHCRHEEAALKEAMGSSEEGQAWLRQAAGLIIAEHHDNETIMLELAEALEEYGTRQDPARADALGYLIRHFFSQMRRHMAWEDQVITELRLIRR